ncbi:MAG: hypothetical protein KIT00_13250 [Rhodospirillales bacterium]|nr:hypothetical protein [Rhodospirillales bacterium]
MLLPHQRDAIQFLLKHLLAGTIGGVLLGAMILWTDVAGLASMIFASSEKYLALTMLFFGLFITFGSIGMAVGVMGLGEERDSDPLN